ncbi:hypothetical protein TNCV_2258421 [Trichonephila clavipes]|nr:hypothetical protein TNCV_2258421 [Trichonephila clavipes]
MTEYTNAEKADMILAHGSHRLQRSSHSGLYAEKHPVRRTPAHTMFARLHQIIWDQFIPEGSTYRIERGNCTRYDHLIGPYILPGHLTGPRYLIFLEQVLPKLLDRAHVTAATRTSMWFQQMEPPHISVFLFGITWMQYVVNDGLAVEVQCIDFLDRQIFPVWLFLLGVNEIVGVRNTW